MKLMRKLSLLIALCVCITVGGVYATWIYSEKTDVADQQNPIPFGLTEAQFSGSYGAYHVDVSGLTMSIDPVTDGSHVAALKITGKIVITFTPNAYAPTEVKQGAVPTTFTLGTSVDQASWKYAGTQIFTVVTTPIQINNWGTPDASGIFTYEISAETLSQMITLGNFVLDTKADYDAFNTALGGGKIVYTISDGITSGSNSGSGSESGSEGNT